MYLCNLSKLNSFLLYEDGWFGEGSLKIDESIINNVKRLLSTFSKQPEIFPLVDGGIQIEWEDENKYLEIQVLLGNQIKIFRQWNDNEEEWRGEYNVERIHDEFMKTFGIT